jgi:hypothetical protein
VNIPNFFRVEIADEYARENFRMLRDYMLLESPFQGFQHFEITLTAAVTNFRYRHSLGFQPKDIIQTSLTGTGVATWNYNLFNDTYLDLTTTGACTVRLFAGTFNGAKR